MTANQLNELWRQSKHLNPANPDPWNKSGLSVNYPAAANIVAGKTASASGTWPSPSRAYDPAHTPENAVDGDTKTYWASNTSGSTWLLIDLGNTKFLISASILWQSGGTYQIRVASYMPDRENPMNPANKWAQVASGAADTRAGDASTVNSFASAATGGWWARYILISPLNASDPQYRAIYDVDLRAK